VRLPVGVRSCWFQNRLDTFVEGVEVLALTPSVESLFELSAGIRVHW
jgi:predicted Rdx family selenoprotein